jgi:putative transposase
MVSPSSKRRAIKCSVEEGWGKTAPACRAVGLNRSSFYRVSQVSLTSRRVHKAVLKLSEKHPRYGYRRITVLLQRGGWLINAKRVQRVRRLEGLQVRRKQRRMRRVGPQQRERLRALGPRQVWSWDFVEDQTENGSRLRILTLLDEYTRECLAVHAAWSIGAADAITVIEAAMARYGTPEHIRSDNGPEFIACALQDWLKEREIKTLSIKPGSPWENCYIESFHDKFRDECLNRELFATLAEARVILESWRIEYNEERPHSSLGKLTPAEFARGASKFGLLPVRQLPDLLPPKLAKINPNRFYAVKQPAELHL